MGIEFKLDGDIRRELCARGLEAAIAVLAARQHGVVARAQLVAAGLGVDAIDHRLRNRRLLSVHRGVYAVGHKKISGHGWYMAAVLAAGPGAVLSYRSAGDLWGVRRTSRRRVDVTTPRRVPSRWEIETHYAPLPDDETTVIKGIPVTTVPRTLFDLAAVVDRLALERAMEQAEAQRLTDPLTLDDLLQRYPARRGTRKLAVALELGRKGITRSKLEERFQALLDEAVLPRPELNAPIELNGRRFEADCLWRKQRLIVELDGRAWHDTRQAFERDRERDRLLQASGWRVVRITWRQLRDDPQAVARDLRRLLR
jgi:predicted transcriptional regulator of viral defense system